jgi:hypothetical protein
MRLSGGKTLATICLALTVVGLCACTSSNPSVCAGAANSEPILQLNAQPWLVAHPGSFLTACFIQTCKELRAANETVALFQPTLGQNATTQFHGLTIFSSGRTIATRRLRLSRTLQNHGSMCRSSPGEAHLYLTATGSLSANTTPK